MTMLKPLVLVPLLLALFGLGPAAAQPYPSTAVKVIVPYGPGGGTDSIARALGERLAKKWNQPVVIENRPGAEAVVGTEAIARSAPDGYALGFIAPGHTLNPSTRAKLPYDTLKDFVPITMVAQTPFALAVSNDTPARTVQELAALAKAQPGKLAYASADASSRLAGEMFNALAGASRAIVTHIPGTTRDVLTERVDIGGIPVTLVDTAGLREATDVIEAEGVARARQAQQIAALTLVVIDRSEPLAAALPLEGAAIVVLSKSDLPSAIPADVIAEWPARPVSVSTTTGDGLQELRERIVSTLSARDDWRDVPAISNVRHLTQIDRALEAFERIDAAIETGATEELVLAELAGAREALEAITGRKTPDDVLRHIFERFCIGK